MNKMILMGAALLLATGCSPTPYVNSHFGDTVRAASLAQADAAKSATPEQEATVDGQVSNAAMDRYHSSYGKPDQTQNVFKIGVGTK